MPRSNLSIGQSVPSQEGDALLRGHGRFTDDVKLPTALVLHLLRSPVAQAKVMIDCTAKARAMAGVHAVHVADELEGLGTLPVNPVLPLTHRPNFPVLAASYVDAVGQPVAAILAETIEQATDAAEAIEIDFDETVPSTGPSAVAEKRWQTSAVNEAFDHADHVVAVSLTHPVLAPSPMEPRAIAVQYHPETESATIWHSTQTPHRSRTALAAILNIDASRLRVIAGDVGGAFGMKGSIYPEEVLAVWAAFHHKRNVRWTASRSEEFLSATHGRGLQCNGELAVDENGRFLALRAVIGARLGHWVPNSGLIPAWNAARILPCAYDVSELDISTNARLTAHPPRGIYRGAGRPEANALMERLVDSAARVTGIDPVALRQRNLLSPSRLPHSTATGNVLDSGDYAALLATLRDNGVYDAALARRQTARANGTVAGVGLAFYVEPSGEGWESARVTLHADRAEIASGSSAQGQWRKTAFAQIAADALCLPIETINVDYGDTGTCPDGIGALASRSTAIGGSAVLQACREAMKRRHAGADFPVVAEIRYENHGQAWGYGAYLAELSIDPETGKITLEQLTCIDDTGAIINPALVRGQIFGGIAQGMGEALMEEIRFDGDGQLLTGSFMDYALPRAADMPPVDLQTLQTPSPMNALGAKGVGEAGTIGAPAAILNAALDAVRLLGVTDLTMPLTPCRVWQAIRNASSGPNT